MEDCVDAGLTRNIGLSNFNSQQIQRIVDAARIPPTNLQVSDLMEKGPHDKKKEHI